MAYVVCAAAGLQAQSVVHTVINSGSVTSTGGVSRFGSVMVKVGDVDGDSRDEFLCTAPLSQHPAAPALPFFGVARLVQGGQTIVRDSWGPTPDFFGWSADGGSDANGDGIFDYMVGAPGLQNTQGGAYLFSGADGALLRFVSGNQPNDYFGTYVCLADCDGDGYADVVAGTDNALVQGQRVAQLRAFSGRNGTPLWTQNGPGFVIRDLVRVGDIDGDGGEDIADSIEFRSGRTGTVIRPFLVPVFAYPLCDVAAAGDVDGDGRGDVLVSFPDHSSAGLQNRGYVALVSSATGLPIREHYGPQVGDYFGDAMAGDFHADNDGVPDYVIRSRRTIQWTFWNARAEIFSGATGAVLQSWTTFDHEMEGGVGVAGDTDGDGTEELAFGAIRNHAAGYGCGAVHIYQIRSGPVGRFRNYGRGCPGSSQRIPIASATGLPRTGYAFDLRVRAASANAVVLCAVGDPVTLPLGPVGAPGCFAHVAPFWIGAALTDAIGESAVHVPVPNQAVLIGLRLDNQWVDIDPAANALGLVTSTAVAVILGG